MQVKDKVLVGGAEGLVFCVLGEGKEQRIGVIGCFGRQIVPASQVAEVGAQGSTTSAA